jgi:hypothetical protein
MTLPKPVSVQQAVNNNAAPPNVAAVDDVSPSLLSPFAPTSTMRGSVLASPSNAALYDSADTRMLSPLFQERPRTGDPLASPSTRAVRASNVLFPPVGDAQDVALTGALPLRPGSAGVVTTKRKGVTNSPMSRTKPLHGGIVHPKHLGSPDTQVTSTSATIAGSPPLAFHHRK